MSKPAFWIGVLAGLVSTAAAASPWRPVGTGGLNLKDAQHQPAKVEAYTDDPPEPRVGEVMALAVYKDPLYAAGEFDTAGGEAISGLARYDGKTWSRVGDRFDGGVVRALVVYQDALYAAGTWKTAHGGWESGLARYDGRAWSSVGALTGGIEAMAIFGARLVVAGLLSGAFGGKAAKIAAWDRKAWSAYRDVPNDPGALGVYAGALYAGGTFLDPARPLPNLYRLKGSKWVGVASFNGAVGHLVADGGALYASGFFTQVAGRPTGAVARYDGKGWSSVGGGLVYPRGHSKDHVATLALIDGALYAGGDLPAREERAGAARWDGKAWTYLGEGLSGAIRAFAVYRGELYAGGRFTLVGDGPTLAPEYANVARRALP